LKLSFLRESFFFFGFALNGVSSVRNHQDPLLSHVRERQVHVLRYRDNGDEDDGVDEDKDGDKEEVKGERRKRDDRN